VRSTALPVCLLFIIRSRGERGAAHTTPAFWVQLTLTRRHEARFKVRSFSLWVINRVFFCRVTSCPATRAPWGFYAIWESRAIPLESVLISYVGTSEPGQEDEAAAARELCEEKRRFTRGAQQTEQEFYHESTTPWGRLSLWKVRSKVKRGQAYKAAVLYCLLCITTSTLIIMFTWLILHYSHVYMTNTSL